MQLAFTDLPSGSDFTLVAATALLASAARQQFTTARLNEGSSTWQRPEIYHLDAWAAAVWQEVRFGGADVPALLSPAQELLLWRTVIEDGKPSLFDPDATARLARAAASVVAQWQIPLDSDAWTDHQDGQEFLKWWRLLRSRCRDSGWMTRADLWRALPKWFERGFWNPGPVAFLGFDRLPPALEHIRAALPQVRVFGTAEEEPGPTSTVPIWTCKDSSEEHDRAARWARERHELQPGASIAVFVPDLAAHASSIRRRFQDVFYPGAALDFAARSSSDSVFHLEAADSLLIHPIVASAYLLLDLAKPEIEQRSASAILRCSYIRGAEQERGARAQADYLLRRDRELELPLATFQGSVRNCPILDKALYGLAKLSLDARRVQRVGAWAQFVADLLNAIGWPGNAELSADEQQAVQSWKDALSELGALGLIAAPLSYHRFLDLLRRHLAASPALACGTWGSPVQIIDARSAAALRFDAAIVTGLGEERWPPAMRVSPLIPLRLQVQQGVRGAGIAAFQKEARLASAALFAAAPAQAATFHGSVSPLVRRFVRLQTAEPAGWNGQLPLASFTQADLEVLADTDAPPFVIAETPVPGGTGIIKSQSNCPFQAFAKYRLHAREFRDASFGLDPLARGNFVHRSLQRVWEELKTQERLRSLSGPELRALVHACVEESLRPKENEGIFASQSRRAEQQRITDLACEWLEQVDATRKNAFTVEQVETEMQFDVAGLPLTIRIDRIDRLPDQSVILIDYKTGRPAQNHLNCPRPREPQLLVYAAASASPVSGIYFGIVRAGESQLLGFGPEKKSPWDRAKKTAEAKDEVERLATDFLDGRAAVDPRKGACAYCESKPICRINEQAGGTEEDCD